jgi:hypothetical protein
MKSYNLKFRTLYFLSFVFIFSFLIFPLVVRGATLYLLPQSQSVYKGDSFLVEIRLDSENEEINTTEVNLKIPSNLLEILDFSKGGTILTFWAKEPELKEGILSLIGGIPGGFKGNGLIGKINFLAKEIGKTEVNFREDSKVLLNDGQGTPAKLNFLEGNYEIVRKPEGLPIISSRTHPDQNKWYSFNTFYLHWDLIEGAEYSFLLSRDPLVQLDDIPDRPEGELIWMGETKYEKLEDGIYYFHLKQKLPGKDWSEKTVFRAMIDSVPPQEFKPEIDRDLSIFEGKYFLSFITMDEISGIDYYEIKEGKRNFERVKSPYLLKDQSLRSKILVKAVDKAGNERISEIIPPAKPFPYEIVILILIGATVIWWLIKNLKLKAKNEKFSP